MPAACDFTVRLDGPIDYAASLEMFRRAGDDLLDRWDGAVFIRTIPLDGLPIAYACTFANSSDRPSGQFGAGQRERSADANSDTSRGFQLTEKNRDRDTLIVNVTVEDSPARARSEARERIEALVRAMFVAPPASFSALVADDPVVAALDSRYPAVRSVRQANLFNALIRCITTQQVNLRWAATCRRRLAEAFGRLHRVGSHAVYSLDPARLAQLQVADLRALQLTTRKAEYIIEVARAIAAGGLTAELLEPLDDEEIIARLTAIRGLGRWSAEWILARTLGRPRVVAGDLGVRKAVALAYFAAPASGAVAILPTEAEIRRATAHWGESTAVVQALLLHALAEKTLPDLVAGQPFR